MIIVLGGSGFIGQHILNSLKRDGIEASGTYFKNNKEGLEYFDIASTQPWGHNLFSKEVRYLIISAAVEVNIDGTRKNWEKSYYINVTKIKAIIEYCFQKGIAPVFISTDNVFDGEKGSYKETDARNPVNCYGRIKYDVENFLLSSDLESIIVRVGKVFGSDMEDHTLITCLMRDLKEGKEVFCADDQVFTPIYVGDLSDAVKKLIISRSRGVYHLASMKATTRLAMANKIKDFFHIKNTKISPCKINSLNLIERRPLLINLDCRKFNELSGFRDKNLEYYLGLIV